MLQSLKLLITYCAVVGIAFLLNSCDKGVTEPVEKPNGDYRTLYLESNPPGAMIFVNEHNMGQKTPDSLVWLASDTNVIKLRLPYFKDTELTIISPKDLKTNRLVDFTKNASMRGGLYIETFPDSAEIFLGDSALGKKTPSYIKGILPGEYTVHLRHYNCRDANLQVTVVSGKTTNHSLGLEDTTSWVTYVPGNSGIPESYFNSVYVDSRDVKWLGGNAKGLTRYDEKNWISYTTTNSNIPSDNINCITGDPNGNLWVGTNNGLARMSGGSFTVFNTTNSGISSNNITALRYVDGDTLWVGTAKGLSCYAGGVWQSFDNEFLGNTWINSLAVSRTGFLYVCASSGLYAYTGTTRYEIPGIVNSNVSAFVLESSGKGWIGTIGSGASGGQLGQTSGRIDLSSSISNPPGGRPPVWAVPAFLGKDVYDLFLTPDNYLFVGTNQGLARCTIYTPNTPTFYRTNDGKLKSNIVKGIRRDSNNNFWIVTSGGGLTKYKGN